MPNLPQSLFDLLAAEGLSSDEVSDLQAVGWSIAEPDKTWIHIQVGNDEPPTVTRVAGPIQGVIDALTSQGFTVYKPGETPYATRRTGRSRTGGPSTSTQGARDVERRSGTQAHRLLAAYGRAGYLITDEEAAIVSGLTGTCYWKRCGELRADGLIATQDDGSGTPMVGLGQAGTPRIVCRITDAGTALLARLGDA